MKAFLFFLLIHASIAWVLCRGEGSDGNTQATNMTSPDRDLREYEKGDKVLLSRKRRFLAFPEGSAFVSTLSIVKALQFTQSPPTNVIIEFDVIWPIPSNNKRFSGAENRISAKKRFYRPSSHWRVHRRQKRDLYSTYEAALDSQGLPGKECILRTICEAQSVLSPPGVSFLEDMLRIFLSNVARSENEMDEYDLAYKSKKDCDLRYQCPFSILELLLSFDQNLHT
ncbi:uncharacterized protein LOC124306876 [Neodiprion virginianus]|uniref:uncharacterized protein LOC124306876 n=1 Tax=Neodiprion virginianus TaxID=2961670 RepID=UPI001EE6DF29|nr:uncharacterized protein LOC124306876 [Neodiprion virginianus]